MADPRTSACWCGGPLGKEIGPHYRRCDECGAAVLAVLPDHEHFDVSDDERDFYGRRYWTEYSTARGLPDIQARARADLSERCVFWLERLLEATRPPGRTLEIGCGHGAFVRLMREVGFDAMGTELSGWVAEFARQTFDVPVLKGRLEVVDLAPGFTCIVALDVLEHVEDPLDLARRCRHLLAADGVLLLQTPWYRGEGPDWSMFQADEHIHLFTEGSIQLLLERAGFTSARVQPSLFPYDMWVVAGPGELASASPRLRTGDERWRLPVAFQSLLDLSRQLMGVRGDLVLADADRAARLTQIEELTRQVRAVEAARREDVDKLTALLRESDADRAARLTQIEELTRQVREIEARRQEEAEARRADGEKLAALLRESDADRAARLTQIEELTALLRESDADRAARLARMEELGQQIRDLQVAREEDVGRLTALLLESEADRLARLNQVEALTRQVLELGTEQRAHAEARRRDVDTLTALLHESETERTARLEQMQEITRSLQESDADRAEQLKRIQDLSGLLGDAEASQAARLEVITNLEARIAEIERFWAWPLYRALLRPVTARRPKA